MDAQWLSPEEVIDLTGRPQPSKQREWFDRYRIPYFQSASGRPVVRRDDLDPSLRRDAPRLPAVPAFDETLLSPLSEIARGRIAYRLGDGPSHSGVYFLFLRWALVYVGQSVKVSARLRAHRADRIIPFNKFSVIDVPRHWLDKVEYHYIAAHRPRFNLRLHPFGGA